MEEETLSPALQAICTSLEEDIFQVDTTFNRTKQIRQNVIERMEVAVMNMKIEPDKEDAEQFMAKMRAVETLSGLLNDQEKNVMSRAQLKLKKKDSDGQQALQLNVTGLMEKINSMHKQPEYQQRFSMTEAERDQLIQNSFDKGGTIIIQEELIIHDDVTALSAELQEEMVRHLKSTDDYGSAVVDIVE